MSTQDKKQICDWFLNEYLPNVTCNGGFIMVSRLTFYGEDGFDLVHNWFLGEGI